MGGARASGGRGGAYLQVLLVAVLAGGPAVVVVVEPGLPGGPAAVVEGGGGGDLVVRDPAELHAERAAAVEGWEGGGDRGKTDRDQRPMIALHIKHRCRLLAGLKETSVFTYGHPGQSSSFV